MPTGKKLPDAGVLETITFGQLSDAFMVKFMVLPHSPGLLTTFIGGGQLIEGPVTSISDFANSASKSPKLLKVSIE